jgi:hypothetical protein
VSNALDFKRLAVTPAHCEQALAEYAGFTQQLGGENGWAGLAAERAILDAIAETGREVTRPTDRYDVDLLVGPVGVEVKTRVAEKGWTHPELFEWLVIPTHAGREPIKAAADLVLFGWYALEEPELYWVLGYLRPEEFRSRSVFYREGEPLPRGGWAPTGGAYALEVRQLRPIPAGFLKETFVR